MEQYRKYTKHYFQYKWLNLCRELDVLNLGENELYIQTDYSAQPVLDPQDKTQLSGSWCVCLVMLDCFTFA